MKKLTIVAFTIPLHGHVNPLLGIVKELAAKGHTVIVYSTPEFKAAIQANGAIFRSAKAFDVVKNLDPPLGSTARDPLKVVDLFMDLTEDNMEEAVAMVRKTKPDIILHDALCLWAKATAQTCHIPAVSLITTLVLSPRLFFSFPIITAKTFLRLVYHPLQFLRTFRRYHQLCVRYGMKHANFSDLILNRERLNIVFTSRAFQPQANQYKQDFLFIGSSVQGREHLKKESYPFLKKQPLVYISLGTIFNTDLPFYHLCMEAFVDAPYNVLLAVGKDSHLNVLQYVPKNVCVRPHVNQIAVLKDAAVFISHGGMNSINEALYYGVPMILFPAIHEQQVNSLRVQQLGAGTVLNRRGLTKERLLEMVNNLVTDARYQKRIKTIQKSLIAAGGPKKAAEKIEKLCS